MLLRLVAAALVLAVGPVVAQTTDVFWRSDFAVPGLFGPYRPGRALAAVEDGAGGIYVGGEFSVTDGVAAPGVAHWDGSAWTPLGSGVRSTRPMACS